MYDAGSILLSFGWSYVVVWFCGALAALCCSLSSFIAFMLCYPFDIVVVSFVVCVFFFSVAFLLSFRLFLMFTLVYMVFL